MEGREGGELDAGGGGRMIKRPWAPGTANGYGCKMAVERVEEGWIILIREEMKEESLSCPFSTDFIRACMTIKRRKKRRGSTVASIDPHRGSLLSLV